MARRYRPFNWCGYKADIERYGPDEAEHLSLQSCACPSLRKTRRT